MTALKIITIILFVLLTIATVQLHPKMHNPMVLENANFKVERISDNYIGKNFKTTTQPIKSSERTVIAENVAPTEVKTITNYTQSAQRQQEVMPIQQQPRRTLQQPQQSQQEKIEDDPLAILQQLIDETQQAAPKTPIQKTVNTQPKTGSNPYMTEQEEIIAWNKWRSDIQNRIMQESNITADFGTMFLFSFVVDKYGNVSNINAWSLSPNYTPMAKRQVKPAISALQGQPILKFPRGTQRTSTIVAGAFTIAFEDRFADPSDFADYERVR